MSVARAAGGGYLSGCGGVPRDGEWPFGVAVVPAMVCGRGLLTIACLLSFFIPTRSGLLHFYAQLAGPAKRWSALAQ